MCEFNLTTAVMQRGLSEKTTITCASLKTNTYRLVSEYPFTSTLCSVSSLLRLHVSCVELHNSEKTPGGR